MSVDARPKRRNEPNKFDLVFLGNSENIKKIFFEDRKHREAIEAAERQRVEQARIKASIIKTDLKLE